MAKIPTPVESLTYEAALGELEEILSALEKETYDLQSAMQQFERGRALLSHCQKLLEEAELKVSQLNADGEMSDWEGQD